VEFSLTGEEFELLGAAAERAGRARDAYAAEAVAVTPFPELLRELIRASGLVRRIGVSLNQAVARLNATGQRSGDLLPYAPRAWAARNTSTRRRKKSGRLYGDIRNAFRRAAGHSGGAFGIPVELSGPRGEYVEGLIYYLYGPGRREEHADPHIAAGWRHPAELEPPLRPDGRRDFRTGKPPPAGHDARTGPCPQPAPGAASP
jgi:hypothetical protein